MEETTSDASSIAPRIVPRRAWLAALLSLFLGGPIGQIYAGHFRRSVVLWFITAIVLPILLFVLATLPLGRYAGILLMSVILAVPVFLAVDAYLVAKRHRDAPRKRYQRWWVYLLAFFMFLGGNQAVARFTKEFIAEAFRVPGRSMSPTILHEDRILIDKLWFNSAKIRRNDVVVFHVPSPGTGPFGPPGMPPSTLYVMRVIGLPDEEIEIKNERVFINGSEWEDGYGVFEGPLPPFFDMANHGPVVVPHDCCFVLGDNRRNARDSRFLGPIPLEDLYGQARFVYWSRDYNFPDPTDKSSAIAGRFRWDRIGMRLD